MYQDWPFVDGMTGIGHVAMGSEGYVVGNGVTIRRGFVGVDYYTCTSRILYLYIQRLTRSRHARSLAIRE
jgi:hypothetical protein